MPENRDYPWQTEGNCEVCGIAIRDQEPCRWCELIADPLPDEELEEMLRNDSLGG